MSWKSDKQRKWGNSPAGIKALGGKAKVAEWNNASEGMKLPMRKSHSVIHAKMGTIKHNHPAYKK